MAELVDALVSNTNDSNIVPVRPRLRVLKQCEGIIFIRVIFHTVFFSSLIGENILSLNYDF